MTDFNPDGYDPDEMSEEEKDQLILDLGSAYNRTIAVAVGMHNSMVLLSGELSAKTPLLRRKRTMDRAASALAVTAGVSRLMLGLDEAEDNTNSEFDSIVAGLDIPGFDN